MKICNACGMHQFLQAQIQCWYKIDPSDGSLEGYPNDPIDVTPASTDVVNWCENCETHDGFIDEDPVYLTKEDCKIYLKGGAPDIEVFPTEQEEPGLTQGWLTYDLAYTPIASRLFRFFPTLKGVVVEKTNGLRTRSGHGIDLSDPES